VAQAAVSIIILPANLFLLNTIPICETPVNSYAQRINRFTHFEARRLFMALGIFWNDDFKREFKVLRRYTVFLIFIPYLALLHKERLPWAIGDLFMNCFMILVMVMVPLSPPNHNFLCSHTQGYIKIITPNDHSIRESNLFFSELTNSSNASSNIGKCLFITGLP
jgi:hypothetical protein